MVKLLNWRFGLIIFAVGIVLMHLPFLNADPNLLHSSGRGAFTDEGLYTAQVRSFIHQKTWDIGNSDALIKTPLFQAFLLIPYFLFGTKMYVARLWVLLSSVFLFVYICKKYHHELLALIALAFVFCQFYIFQYLQVSMAEMLCVICVFIGLILANQAVKTHNFKQLFLAVLVINASYYFKIQFVNSLIIIPAYLFFLWLHSATQKSILAKMFGWSLLFNIVCITAFCLVWYIPNYQIFNYVLQEQAKSKFTEFSLWPIRAQELVKLYFWNTYTWLWSIVVLIAIVSLLVQFKKIKDSKYNHLLGMIAIWILIESYKLTMHYAPSRYFVALYFAVGIFASICLTFWLKSVVNKFLPSAIVVILLLVNAFGYYQLLTTRTFAIKQIDNYLASVKFDNEVILGTWAASVSWQNKARTLPIWDNYFNYQNPLEVYKPKLLILEQNETDCDQLFQRNNIDLKQISDSVISFQVGNWPLNLYWLK
jgi:hypothetical protein